MKVWAPFYRRPLPVWNAPAINNAIIATMAAPPVSLYGSGVPVRGQFLAAEGAQNAAQSVVLNPLGVYQSFTGTYPTQGLINPKAK